MAKELRVLVQEEELGSLLLERGRIRLVYDDAWLHSAAAFPLSLSMPMWAREHGGSVVENYLWNLLPDREATLLELARRYSISPRNPFALVGAHGQDLPGAVQVLPPEKVEASVHREGVKLIGEAKLAEFLNRLVLHPSLNRISDDANHFSLAGAQPKKAILWIGEKWYEHKGRTPTTHILKPPMRDLESSVENEHFCLRLAAAIGLSVAKSEVVSIGGTPTIVVERYDRVRLDGTRKLPLTKSGGVIYRVHQEDFCQALGVHPQAKYQNMGGPSMSDIMHVLEGSADAATDRERFMRACVFNFIILGIDAHAKNYSVLIDHDGFRLAPLYDIISAVAYDTHHFDKLAMKVGTEYRWRYVAPRHWEAAAKECRYPADVIIETILNLSGSVADQCGNILADCRDAGLQAPFLDQLANAIEKRCAALRRTYS